MQVACMALIFVQSVHDARECRKIIIATCYIWEMNISMSNQKRYVNNTLSNIWVNFWSENHMDQWSHTGNTIENPIGFSFEHFFPRIKILLPYIC